MSQNRGYQNNQWHRRPRDSVSSSNNSESTYRGNAPQHQQSLTRPGGFGQSEYGAMAPPPRPTQNRGQDGAFINNATGPIHVVVNNREGPGFDPSATAWSQTQPYPNYPTHAPSPSPQFGSRAGTPLDTRGSSNTREQTGMGRGEAAETAKKLSVHDILVDFTLLHPEHIPCNNCGRVGHQPSQCIKADARGFMAKITCSPCNSDSHQWVNCRRRLALPKDLRERFDYKFTFLDRLAKCPQDGGLKWEKQVRHMKPGTLTPYRSIFAIQLFHSDKAPDWRTFRYTGDQQTDAAILPKDEDAALQLFNKSVSVHPPKESRINFNNAPTRPSKLRQTHEAMDNDMDIDDPADLQPSIEKPAGEHVDNPVNVDALERPRLSMSTLRSATFVAKQGLSGDMDDIASTTSSRSTTNNVLRRNDKNRKRIANRFMPNISDTSGKTDADIIAAIMQAPPGSATGATDDLNMLDLGPPEAQPPGASAATPPVSQNCRCGQEPIHQWNQCPIKCRTCAEAVDANSDHTAVNCPTTCCYCLREKSQPGHSIEACRLMACVCGQSHDTVTHLPQDCPTKVCNHPDCKMGCESHCMECGYPSKYHRVLSSTTAFSHVCQWTKHMKVNKETGLPMPFLVCNQNASHDTVTATELNPIRSAAYGSLKREHERWVEGKKAWNDPSTALRPECRQCWSENYGEASYKGQDLPEIQDI